MISKVKDSNNKIKRTGFIVAVDTDRIDMLHKQAILRIQGTVIF